jgi:hypothetical protein
MRRLALLSIMAALFLLAESRWRGMVRAVPVCEVKR